MWQEGKIQCRICDTKQRVYDVREGEHADVRYRAVFDAARELRWIVCETHEGTGICPDCG